LIKRERERERESTRRNSGTGWIKQLTTVVWNRIYQVRLERNLARRGKEYEKRVYSVLTRFRSITLTETRINSADLVSTMLYASKMWLGSI